MKTGVINVYKEKDYTSHDVVAIVRGILKVKAGHTGTLDPNAVGVLPICLGKATRLADYISKGIKGYTGILKLGIVTDTLDLCGIVLEENEVNVKREEIKEAINSFVGVYDQVPPMYSAKRVDGVRLYELARQGIKIKREPSSVEIFSIDIVEFIDDTTIKLNIICSKGTYIRSLFRDIGEKLGCGASMGDLIRYKTGSFSIEDSYTLDEIRKFKEAEDFSFIIAPDDAIKEKKSIKAVEESKRFLINGNKISINYIERDFPLELGEIYKLYNWDNKFVGLYEVEDEFIRPRVITMDFGEYK